MIQVAHVITGLYTGGAEIMLYKLLARTDRTRFNPLVVSLVEGGSIVPKIESLGISVYRCGMHRGIPGPLSATRLVRILRHVQPDLLQGWMYHGNLAAQAVAAALPGRVPVLWNIRGSHHILRDEKATTAAAIWLGARLSKRPVRILCNSTTSARLHEEHLGFASDRWEIIPNGFELDKYAPSAPARADVRQELGVPADALLLGLMGRYNPVKDHGNFLRAARSMRAGRENKIYFVMAGTGVDGANRELARQIAELGLNGSVRLLGERDDMPRVTAALDLAVNSSYSEGFPNVVGEAMSCGVPCVVTDVGDSAWLVGNTGFKVAPRDSEALAAACRTLIDLGAEGRRALGLAARQRVASEFSLDSVSARYESLYETVLDRHKEGKDLSRCAA
ncbi:MAG: glycosyltransferase [Bryobacteraceae bacterium]